MSKAFLKQRTNSCDTLNPFFSRSSLHLRCVSDKFMSVISYTGTYFLCVVVVIVCNKHWKQGIQIELTCHSKLFHCSPNQCQHHLYYIHIPCQELSCFTVTVFQNFRFECMVSTFYVSKQRRLMDHIILLV